MTTSSRQAPAGLYRRHLLATMGLVGALAITGLSRPGFGQSLGLDQARNQGLVGERLNGLIGVVQNAPGVDALVDRVNAARMERYREIAADTDAPLDAVQARAGQQLIQRAQSGWYVESSPGTWQQVP